MTVCTRIRVVLAGLCARQCVQGGMLSRVGWTGAMIDSTIARSNQQYRIVTDHLETIQPQSSPRLPGSAAKAPRMAQHRTVNEMHATSDSKNGQL